MQGYPNFGAVKTIVIPALVESDGPYTLDQYKEKFGIDFRDFVTISPDGRFVHVDFGFSLVLVAPFNTMNDKPQNIHSTYICCRPADIQIISDNPEHTIVIKESSKDEVQYNGIQIVWAKTGSFENAKILAYAI